MPMRYFAAVAIFSIVVGVIAGHFLSNFLFGG